MNSKALKTLEYDKIIEQLASYASSPMGRKKCLELAPSSSLSKITRMQQETHDALNRLFKKGRTSFGDVKDLRGSLKRLEIGSTMNIVELLSTAALLENTARIKTYGRRENADLTPDCLEEMFDLLEPLTPLSTEIRRCILSEDEISDDASPKLRQIRRSIKSCEEKIHSQLISLVNGSYRTYLQDAVITMRDGRYCIPIKSEYKGQVPGMIHDQSSTGSTFFVEPMAVVKLNNDIRELEIEEEKEIEVILASLSAQVDLHRDEIRRNIETMAELDFIFARAALAMEQNANEPIFNTEGRIHLRKARHPLIDPKKVVPIDLTLGEDFDLLIVTGPNTGGKTVSLKTVGLLTLMGQSGLHIPALDRSSLAVFEEVYADIGDEQSIEQSLSTFSSHMTNVVSFLSRADANSLVLFDELGAGTDPTEGAALAIAILSTLHEQGIRTMATTHYSELKIYALSTEGVENACCEFDVDTLSPTYRLLVGVPGKSNAFAISSKLGLPDEIIQRAKEQISEQDESFEDVLSTLEQNRITMEKEQAELARYRQEVETLKASLSKDQEKLDARRDKLIAKANEEAQAILREAKEYADQTLRDFQRFGKENVSVREMEKKRTELREKMNKLDRKKAEERPKQTGNLKASDLSIGDAVKVLSLNVKGTVSTRPDSRGNLFVQMGIMRTKVNISDLVLIDEPVITGPALSKTSSGKTKLNKAATISTEINLLGKTVDEAIAELDKYLDDAYLSHLPSVRVVHGKGTGALRKGIHNYLRTQKHVSNYHLAEFGEGDAGVTIVEFKK
ncbi:MAG: endonuclease MutS2 [Fusicatenibacter sp.]|nr:endonuclease MutS2 [Lachnospiraceae bacterium]MDY2938802.1 endonuclease MutS2 [Fusicatenibacter sp.]